MTTPDAPGLVNWIRLGIVGVIWGAAFMGVSIALKDLPPLTVAAGRVTLGAIALYSLMWARGVKFPPLKNKVLWRYILVLSLVTTAIPFSLLSWGQQFVPSAFAGMSMASVPLFVLVLAHFFVPGEQMFLRKVIGFIFGFVGTILLVGGGLEASSNNTETLARIACVSAALCYSVGAIVTKLCPPVNELALSAASLFLAAVMLLVAAFWVDGVPNHIPTRAAWALLYLGLLPTAAAFLLKVAINRSAGPTFMTLVNYQVPLWSILFGSILLGERLPPMLFIAFSLVLLGLAISQWGTLKRLIKQ